MRKFALVIVALFVPALGLQAEEVQTEQDSLSLFAQLDEDKDGLVSKEEATRVENILAMFDALDADGDGQLTLSEFEALARNEY